MKFSIKAVVLLWSVLTFYQTIFAQPLPTFQGNTTPTYFEVIKVYEALAKQYSFATFKEIGTTDCGKPLHVFIISNGQENPLKVLINNGIHPGESCGIDASILLAKHYCEMIRVNSTTLENIDIAIIPIFNIGGALNRNSGSRTNQVGPAEHGFRGNALNYDLNRDFIKMDSKNTLSLVDVFTEFMPDLFFDTHTTNGADYQHTMTLISPQKERLPESLGQFTTEVLDKALYQKMRERDYPMSPYVNVHGQTPDHGISVFDSPPRYFHGFAALFNCLGYVTEAHMLKTYEQRVNATIQILDAGIVSLLENRKEFKSAQATANDAIVSQKMVDIGFELDSTSWNEFEFMGYKATKSKSMLTQKDQLHYDRSQPWEAEVKIFDHFKAIKNTTVDHYYMPLSWFNKYKDKFDALKVKYEIESNSATLNLNAHYIQEYKTVDQPFEGHYLHHSTTTIMKRQNVFFPNGYAKILAINRQAPQIPSHSKWLAHAMDPRCEDSWFNWNFFDEILQQKEWFSSYIFEDEAAEILANDPELKSEFEAKQKEEPEFAKSAFAQLYWIYKQTDHYEKEHKRLPIFTP